MDEVFVRKSGKWFKIRTVFRTMQDTSSKDIDVFVPGRICLFGEHSDWAGGYRTIDNTIEKGYTIITGINQGIYAHISKDPSNLIVTSTDTIGKSSGPYKISMDLNDLLAEAESGSYLSYIAGVAYNIKQKYPVSGLIINNYRTDLPIKKGLSSSAAICVLTARSFNRIYSLGLSTQDEMELAYQGEILTKSKCGRMDQGCAYGNCPILMIFEGDKVEIEKLEPKKDLFYVVADLNAQKDTKVILSSLNKCYPISHNSVCSGVQKLLGNINKEIVSQARSYINQGSLEKLGALMQYAQSEFDRYAVPACPEELSAPILHKVLNDKYLKQTALGGKGVGSQGDGSVQFLAKNKSDQNKIAKYIINNLKMNAFTITVKSL